jgi:hypothetical protein
MANVIYTLNGTVDQEINIPCVTCAGTPSHKVMASFDEAGSEGDRHHSFDWQEYNQVVQCLGCKTISFRKASMNSEEYYQVSEDDFEHAVSEKLFPSRLVGRKGLGEDARYLPQTVSVIYDETLAALANQCPVLSGIGLRALIETICKEKNAVGKDLFSQIDSLQATHILTPNSATVLHKIRTLGNAAAHEVKPHSEKQLGLAMDIIEQLLREVYILPKQVAAEFDI